jgi:thiol:disulfide interchange protein DsbC
VRATPIAGLFEVAMGRKIVYVDATGQYFLFGRIFRSARQPRPDRRPTCAASRRLDVSLIQPDQTLEQGGGQPGRVRVLRSGLRPLPEAGADPGRHADATGPDDPVAAATGLDRPGQGHLVRAGSPARLVRLDAQGHPARSRIRRPARPDVLARNLALATRFGIRATPALVSPDGRVSLGALEAPALSAWLTPDQAAVATVCPRGQPMNYRHLIPCLLLPTLVGCAGSLSGPGRLEEGSPARSARA